MPLTPGSKIVKFNPFVRWAPQGTAWPSMEVRYGESSPGWIELEDLVSGAEVTNRAPREGIFSDKRGRIDSVPAAAGGGGGGRSRGGGGGGRRGGGGGGGRGTAGGGAGTSVAFEAETLTAEFWRLVNKLSKNVVAPASKVVEFKFATGASGNGTLTFTPDDGGSAVTVAVTSASQGTAAQVATAVAGATFTGYTATVKTGATDTVVLTKTTTGRGPNWSFNGGATGVTMAALHPKVVQPGHSGMNVNYVDRHKEFNWSLWIDGVAQGGGFFAEDTLVRLILPRVENTQDGQDVWAHDGRAAVVDANVMLEALPEDPATVQAAILGTGIPYSAIDPDRKMVLIDTLKV